jgi:citrate synthase
MAVSSASNETIWISADEAAHRLGVSKPTLYAYVSRGKIRRTLAEDGRRSRFNAAEVATLARGKPKPPTPGMTELRLASAVTRIDETGLFYRGVPIGSLVGRKSFEEVAALLWQQEPSSWVVDQDLVERIVTFRTVSVPAPQTDPRSQPKGETARSRTSQGRAPLMLTGPLSASLRDPSVGPFPTGKPDWGPLMLTGPLSAPLRDPSGGPFPTGKPDWGPGHRPGQAASQIAQLVLQLGYLDSEREAVSSTKDSGDVSDLDGIPLRTSQILSVLSASLPGVRKVDRTVAARLWRHLSHRAPRSGELELIDAALVALADHELATATLAVRLAASTRADLYAAIASGLTVLTGPLHGSASAGCYRMLASAADSGRPARAVDEALADFGLVHGFGHKVYKRSDPRSVALLRLLHQADVDRGKRSVVDAVLAEVKVRIPQPDNIDFALGAITLCCDLPPSAGELLFCFARIAGWAAHYTEELAEPPLRFRVRAVYQGE